MVSFQIYKTVPWKFFNDSTQHEVYYTASRDATKDIFEDATKDIFAILLEWPTDDLIGE